MLKHVHTPMPLLPTRHRHRPNQTLRPLQQTSHSPLSPSLPPTFKTTPLPPKQTHRTLMEKKPQTETNGQQHGGGDGDELPLMALNHVSRLCRSVKESIEFYSKVLGFVLIEQPAAFDFDGAWLFNYGVGIHLVQAKDEEIRLPHDPQVLDPMDNHISFQCEDMDAVVHKLEELNIKYIKRTVGEKDGAPIDQLFFNDPDGFMIEICNCENLKLVPAGSFGRIKLPLDRHNPPVEINGNSKEQVAKAS